MYVLCVCCMVCFLQVIFSLEKRKFRLVVDGIRAQDGQMTTAEFLSMQHFLLPVYLGSVPESLHKALKVKANTHCHLTQAQKQVLKLCFMFFYFQSKALPKQSASGCIRNFKMNGAPMSNPTTNRGAGPCFEGQSQRGAYFSGNGAHVIISEYNTLMALLT